MKPEVVKKSTKNNETGCCFRSCGGTPCVQEFEGKSKTTKTEKILKKI